MDSRFPAFLVSPESSKLCLSLLMPVTCHACTFPPYTSPPVLKNAPLAEHLPPDAHFLPCPASPLPVCTSSVFSDCLFLLDPPASQCIDTPLTSATLPPLSPRFSMRLYPSIRADTFLEACGMADLVATCYGGRNRLVAEEFAKAWLVSLLGR